MEKAALLETITALIPNAKVIEEGVDRPAIELPPAHLPEAAKLLHDTDDFAFDMLCAHTAIDRIDDGKFELVYQLYSTKFHHYLMLSVKVDREHPVVPSVSSVWRIAQWHEREVYDLFGVLYDNHPDLRRLFLEDDWQGHPLRKDYRDDFMLTME
ncbi:NADH-quinone oxidoreductase subunit C [bacterium]|nr:MAG: NADH-quinone oxidoreductase subunit C [bacterium]